MGKGRTRGCRQFWENGVFRYCFKHRFDSVSCARYNASTCQRFSRRVRIISWRDRITLLINLIFRRKSCPSLMMLLPPHHLAPIKFKVAIPPLQAQIFREEEAQSQIHHLSLLTPGKCFPML
ncbi:unnamed protein product [Arabidopsis lyrata]|nr:unnamed protein product [Arabidopsis lyrata]